MAYGRSAWQPRNVSGRHLRTFGVGASSDIRRWGHHVVSHRQEYVTTYLASHDVVDFFGLFPRSSVASLGGTVDAGSSKGSGYEGKAGGGGSRGREELASGARTANVILVPPCDSPGRRLGGVSGSSGMHLSSLSVCALSCIICPPSASSEPVKPLASAFHT